MAQRDRLRGLEMGETGHDALGMFPGAHDQRHLQRPQPGIGLFTCIAHPQAEVGRHLVVAAARGVQPPGRRADQFGQPAFGGHVDVFEVPVLGHAVRLVFGGDRVQPLGDQRGVFRRDDALRAQHGDMGLGRGDVLPPQRLVERDRGVYLAHDRRRAGGETPAPHLVGA